MCELGLHISSAGGTRGVCTCRALGGILAGCVCVCVFLHRLCVRMDQWVCVPLPLVFLKSKTLTSSEKGTFHPLPIIIQLFQVSFKRGIFYADYRRNKLKHNCVRHLKILTAPRPPLLILSVWKSFLPACCRIWVSLLLLSYHQSSSERVWKRDPPKQGGVLRPSSCTPADSYSDRGFQTLTCRGRTAQGTISLHHVLRLGYFYMNALSLLCKKEKKDADKQVRQRGNLLYSFFHIRMTWCVSESFISSNCVVFTLAKWL